VTKRHRLFLILGISFLALSGAYVVLIRETVAPDAGMSESMAATLQGDEHGDRDANACQLATLHTLQISEPYVQIVVGHDGERMHELETGGFISPRFQ